MPGISRLFFLAVLAHIGHRSLSSSGAPLENPFPLGTIGCLASDVCGPQEVCKDDLLFGSCQEPRGGLRSALGSRGSLDPHHRHGPDVFHLQTVEIEELEQTIWTLIRDGFTWQDAYTQCTLQNLLVAFKRGLRFSSSLCEDALGVRLPARGDDGAAGTADWARASSAEIAAVLKELMKAQDDGDLTAVDRLGQDAHAADGFPMFERDSRRIAGPFLDERGLDPREEDEEGVEESLSDYDLSEDEEDGLDLLGSNKRDEFVQVHKYFDKSKGQLKRDPYLAEGRLADDPYTSYLAAYRRQQALARASSGTRSDNAVDLGLDDLDSAGTVGRDPGLSGVRDQGSPYLPLELAEEGKAVKEEDGKFFDLPPDMVEVEPTGRETVAGPESGQDLAVDNKFSSQSQGADNTAERPLTLSPRDEATLERLLEGTVEPDQLPVDQQRRLSSFIETMIARLEQRGSEHDKDLQSLAVLPAGALSDPAGGQADDSPASQSAQPREPDNGDRPQDPVNSDLQLEKKSPALPEEESTDEATKEKNKAVVHTEYTYLILNNNLTPEQAEKFVTNLTHLLHVPEGVANLNQVNGDQVIIKLAQDPQWNSSKLAREAQDNAEALYQETGLKVVDAGIGKGVTVEVAKKDRGYVVLTFILVGSIAGVVLAVTIIYLIKRHRRSRDKLAQLAATGDGNEASKDYQDLCRQRMQSKASEKPEPLHAASRIGSVSESQVRSPSSRSSTSSWSEEPAASNMDISTGHVVLAYMEDHLRNQDRLDQEWEALAAYQADPCSTAIASDPANARKNRYSDVLPYDHSRVVLAATTNVNNSDYINASFITDHDPRNPAYICTQGPLPHTVADFWQMVWEQGSVVIVMLTKLHAEDGSALCHRYWPEEGSDLYHIYEVHLVSEHIWCDDYLVRSFYLKNLQTNETRTVTQFHFLTWTHLTVPPSMKALLDFRRKVNKSFRGGSCPIVVHCNDGCGRSGTYVLVDMVLNRMAKGAKEIDMAATLEHIRDQRMNMVQTKEQFQFALSAVAEEVHAILKAMPQ